MAGVGTPRTRKEALGGMIQGTERMAGGWRVGWGGGGHPGRGRRPEPRSVGSRLPPIPLGSGSRRSTYIEGLGCQLPAWRL